ISEKSCLARISGGRASSLGLRAQLDTRARRRGAGLRMPDVEHARRADREQQLRAARVDEHEPLTRAERKRRDDLQRTVLPRDRAERRPPQQEAARDDQPDDREQAHRHRRDVRRIDSAHYFSDSTRFSRLTTSSSRTPKRSLTTTTSPCATSVPFTSTPSGSPASLSSSTTEPCVSASRLRTLIRVRPTSSVTSRRTSIIRSRLSWPSPPVAAADSSPNSARAAAAAC